MISGWNELSEAATTMDSLADQVEALLAHVAELIDHEQDDVEYVVLPLTKTTVSREVAAAAARLRHAAIGVQVLSADLVDANRVHRYDAAHTPRQWLARHAGLSQREASALCRSAEARHDFGRFDDAFCEGDVTASHLDALAGIIPARLRGAEREQLVEAVREIEPTLLEQAGELSLEQFVDLCGRIRSRLEDGPGDRSAEPSRVWLSQTFNGRWSLKGDLSALDGALLASMLDDAVARLKGSTASSDSGEPAEAAEAAEPTEPTEATGSEPAGGTPEHQPWSERRAEALADLMRRGAGTTRPGRISLFVHIDLEDLAVDDPTLEELARRQTNAHTEAGIDIEPESLWGLLAGADVTPIFNWNGTSLCYGRTERLAPPILRRVLAHRDRTCRFPGCTLPANGCQLHHIVEWDSPEQGETNPTNLVNLESKHHHDHHDRGWTISGDADDLVVQRPSGERFDAQPAYRERLHRRRRAERDLVSARLDELSRHIRRPDGAIGEADWRRDDRR